MNIRQLEELPTAQEFAARQREQAWLAEQAEKEREASEQERLRRMAENQHRWAEERRQREEAKQRREQERAAKREAKVRQKAGGKRSRVALVVVAVGVLMLAGGGTAAYVLVSDPGRAAQNSPPVSAADGEPPEATGSDSECSTGQIPSGAYTIASMELSGAVTCEEAQDTIGALLSGEGTPLGRNTTLDGTTVGGFLCFGPKTGGANCTREEDDSEVVVQLAPALGGGACSAVDQSGVRIVQADAGFGCDVVTDLAARTVRDGGFLQTEQYFCRWAQGGSSEILVDGQSFFPGFCTRVSDEATVEFLARKADSRADATVVPRDFEYCPMFETRDRGVFEAGVQGVECSEAQDVLAQTVQTDAVVGDWTCDKDELTVCTSADLGAEIRYRFSVAESP